MTPQRRIEILKELGVEVTPEREAREYKISLDTVARTYGANWEQDADAIRNLIAAAEAGDVPFDSWADERVDTGLMELNAPYRPATGDMDGVGI